MRRRLIDTGMRFITWLRRHQRVRPRTDVVRINLGSGVRVAPGWIHVDGSLNAMLARWPKPILSYCYGMTTVKQWCTKEQYIQLLRSHDFVHHSLGYGLPFDDETVDYVYSSHLLEHLFRNEAEQLLREAFRVLKKGGRIRICVPDLEHAVGLYLKGEKLRALEFFFTTSRSGVLSRHQYMYDFELLRQLLEQVGFVDVERCTHRQGKTPDIQVLDNRPEQTLYVEAVKP